MTTTSADHAIMDRKKRTRSQEDVLAHLEKIAPHLVDEIYPERDWLWFVGEVEKPEGVRLLETRRPAVCEETGEELPEGTVCWYKRGRKGEGKSKIWSLESTFGQSMGDAGALMECGFIHAPNGHPLEELGLEGTWSHSCEHPIKFRRRSKASSGGDGEPDDERVDPLAALMELEI